MFERNSRNANNTIGYTRTSAIAERPATGNHQDAMQRKNACQSLDASNSSYTNNNSNASNRQHKAIS
jgi:hypothetical protein